MFDDFYSKYPKKVARKDAQKAYAVVDLSREIHNTNQIEIHYF